MDPFRFSRRTREIIATIAESHGVKPSEITTGKKGLKVVNARHAAVWQIAQEFPEKSSVQIAKVVGYKNHSTVTFVLGRCADKKPANGGGRVLPCAPRFNPLPPIEDLIAAYNEAGTVTLVAERFGVYKGRVAKALDKAGVDRPRRYCFRPRKRPESLCDEQIIATYDAVGSVRRVAQILQVAREEARSVIRKARPVAPALTERLDRRAA